MRDALAGLAHGGHRKPVQDGDQQHLQQIALGEGVEQRVRNDRQQVGDDALLLGARDVACHGLGVELGGVDVEAFAGLQHLADEQTDSQRYGRTTSK
jgi:hypothetical protein